MNNSNTNIGVACFLAFLFVLCVLFIILIRKHAKKRQKQISSSLLIKYPRIYRVTSISGGVVCPILAENASISIGDYGWEAEPIHNDGLTYLHGLNKKWQVVWYAGFRFDQVEFDCQKTKSQYYIFPEWMARSLNIPECPFSVQKYPPGNIYKKDHFGFPVKSEGDWFQGMTLADTSNNISHF